MSDRLQLVPISLREANAYVRLFHRHHKPARGHKFSIGAKLGGALVGVVIVGRPVARMQDDGYTAEILRNCTNGTHNACSFLNGAAVRAAFAMGYRRVITKTLATEQGASLRAAGFKCLGERKGGRWSRPNRPRLDDHPTGPKLEWERAA